MTHQELRKSIRKDKIKARDSYTVEERAALSEKICKNILESSEYKSAKTIMIYKAVRGEASLSYLEANAFDKTLVYPLCISTEEMIALKPHGEDSWQPGYKNIPEPVRELSDLIDPKDIDLVICPCSVFDENHNRMGMGAGFYDRFLPKCVNATIVAAAFEAQKYDDIPVDPWDKPMDAVFTELKTY